MKYDLDLEVARMKDFITTTMAKALEHNVTDLQTSIGLYGAPTSIDIPIAITSINMFSVKL